MTFSQQIMRRTGMEMKRHKSTVKFKLYSVFIVSFAVPLTVLSICFIVYYYCMTMTQEERSIENILNLVGKNMEMQHMELMNICDTYYLQNEVFDEIEALNNPSLYQFYGDLERGQMENEYTMLITKMIHTANQEVRDVVFFPISSRGGEAYYIDKRSAGLKEIQYPGYEKEEWFLRTLEADGEAIMWPTHETVYAVEDDKAPVYSCIRAIKDVDTKRFIGVVKIDAELRNLRELINVLEDKSSDGMMISAGDQILVSSDTLPEGLSYSADEGIRRVGARLYYQKSMELPESGWNVTYIFYMGEIFINCLWAVLVTVFVILMASLLAFRIYKKNSNIIVEDTGNILVVLKEVQKGNLDARVSVKGDNELWEIETGVNSMVENLKEYINQKYIWVINQQKAEYMALQSQINPHFLYNTLNGFIALNRMGEKKKLEKAIIQLTHLFRYTCTKADTTTVADEMKFLKEYLELEKLKYDERLEYMIWIDDECQGKVIPKLLLQPVVENSIIHGMGDSAQPIMITIIARQISVNGIGDVMVIGVRDNGVGFDTEEVNKKERVGIENVRKRMELYCSNSLYQTLSVPGKGTKTTLVFPEQE